MLLGSRHRHSVKKTNISLILATSLLAACGGGGGKELHTDIYKATSTPSDPAASAAATSVMAYLAALSNGTIPGVLAGQNTGHGDQILNATGTVGYAPLIDELELQTGEAPAVVGLDYEYEQIYTPAQLSNANQKLIEHWQAGGLITINWSPNNPWWNDESDLANNPGGGDLTRTYGGDMTQVKLGDLINSTSSIHAVWRTKLDRIAAALKELQDAGVVVLWRPMQEMNGSWFWWGISTQSTNCSGYTNLWKDMYTYFTQVKGLHNLLWVYSPNRGPENTNESYGIASVDWCYPGADYVDVVAGTRYDDSLSIADYNKYKSFDKPLGMAELGPTLGGAAATAGSFDTRNYTKVLANYPAVSYWVNWHDWNNGNGTREHQALVGNQHTSELLQDAAVITRSEVNLNYAAE